MWYWTFAANWMLTSSSGPIKSCRMAMKCQTLKCSSPFFRRLIIAMER
jgi:hypothetical protein